MLQQHGIELTYPPAVVDQVVAASGMHETGGRRIAQHIERLILPKLANVWLSAMRESIPAQKLQLALDEKSAYVVHVRDVEPDGHDTKSQSTTVIENI
jgi:ATP-dependent Clp protease ATP-binding subunit ClpA